MKQREATKKTLVVQGGGEKEVCRGDYWGRTSFEPVLPKFSLPKAHLNKTHFERILPTSVVTVIYPIRKLLLFCEKIGLSTTKLLKIPYVRKTLEKGNVKIYSIVIEKIVNIAVILWKRCMGFRTVLYFLY